MHPEASVLSCTVSASRSSAGPSTGLTFCVKSFHVSSDTFSFPLRPHDNTVARCCELRSVNWTQTHTRTRTHTHLTRVYRDGERVHTSVSSVFHVRLHKHTVWCWIHRADCHHEMSWDTPTEQNWNTHTHLWVWQIHLQRLLTSLIKSRSK